MASEAEPSDSPIQRVIDAIVVAADLQSGFECFLDCYQDDLQRLAKHIIEYSEDSSKKTPLFIQTPFGKEDKEGYQRWITLLESVMKQTRTGIIAEIEKVIPKILEHSSLSSVPIKNIDQNALIISPWDAPEKPEEVEKAHNQMATWAKLESLTEVDRSSVFSHLTGGLRPLVFVFDDYNNYLQSKAADPDCFTALAETNIPADIPPFYGQKDMAGFRKLLTAHCGNLNNLSVSCEVNALKVWIGNEAPPDYEQVAKSLPFARLDRLREQIGAFLVDLEWKPTVLTGKADEDSESSTKDWTGMGYRAIHLLSQRFPEIPCFVYTGDWTEDKLQEALAHGAMWCFYKESHHGSFVPKKRYQITCLEFERHLLEASKAMYGAFSELPFPGQLILDPGESASKTLLKKLGLWLPIERSTQGKNLLRIVAKLFPNGDQVRPVKVFDSGKSKAQATFIVRPSRNDVPYAPRFMKVAPWLEIQREYLAYQRVIRPRLGRFAILTLRTA